MEIIHLDTIDSTNRYCELLDLSKVEEFTIVWTSVQTAGRGQQDHSWESEPNKNLTFSLILHPTWLPIADQFQLHKVLSLALTDYLYQLGVTNVRIKWPNDIYVGGKKICGILVSNKLAKGSLSASICGVGLNVNQEQFPDWVPNPVSIFQILHHELDLKEAITHLAYCIQKRYILLEEGNNGIINNDYLSHLMNLGVECAYQYGGKQINATITGVNQYGHLLLSTHEKEEICCQMGEISLIINN